MSARGVVDRVLRSRRHVGRRRRIDVPAQQLWRLMNLFPPFLGMGLRVHGGTDDWTEVRVKLLLTPLNRNTHGTAFGGSIGAMTDAFHALLLGGQLGRGYDVWDAAMELTYVSPGAGTVHGVFRVEPEQTREIRAEVDANGRARHWFPVDLMLADGTVVARARRQVYVRRRAAGGGS